MKTPVSPEACCCGQPSWRSRKFLDTVWFLDGGFLGCVFFTDCLGEKEWHLLMFLGEAAIERCYFVLRFPRPGRVKEAQVFQRVLKLKPSQLLFWEGGEWGRERKEHGGLQAALQEVMSSSLRCVMEDMAPWQRVGDTGRPRL